MAKTPREIAMSLLKNSEDFAEEAIRNAVESEKNPKRWKFAMLHLVQATELCLKGVLEQEHPSLVFEVIDKGDRMVAPMQAFNRVQKWAKKSFSNKDRDTLEKSIKFRNEAVHGEVRFNSDQMKARFAKLCGFLQELIRDCFEGEHLSDSVSSEVWAEFLKIKEHVEELRRRGRKEFEALSEECHVEDGIACPVCREKLLCYQTPGHEDVRCCCCGFMGSLVTCDCGEVFASDAYDPLGYDPVCDGCIESHTRREQELFFDAIGS